MQFQATDTVITLTPENEQEKKALHNARYRGVTGLHLAGLSEKKDRLEITLGADYIAASRTSSPTPAQVTEPLQQATALFRREEERRAALPRIHADGVEALQRLLKVALGHSGQCRIVAAFLLSCYNGNRFKFDLTDFRCLDHALFEDCLAVLRMDYQPAQEVHTYFKNGSRIWEQMAKDWNIRDYTKRTGRDAE